MNEAIKLAIEGGYIPLSKSHRNWPPEEQAFIALDPLFWQALGKALKMDQPIWDCHKNYPNARCGDNEFCEYGGWKNIPRESMNWFDVHVWGGDENKFWSDLLKGHE